MVSDPSLELSPGPRVYSCPLPRLPHRGSHRQRSQRRGAARKPRCNQNCGEAPAPWAWPGSAGVGRGRRGEVRRGTSGGRPRRQGRDSALVLRGPPACPSSAPTERSLADFNVLSISVREGVRTWRSPRSQVRPACAGVRSSPLGDEECQGVCV